MKLILLFVCLFLVKKYFLKINKKKYFYINKIKNFKKIKHKYKLKCNLNGVEFKVQNLNNSIDFYKNVLNFKIIKKEETYAILILNENGAYIKLQQNNNEDFKMDQHSFLGLGIELKNFDIHKTIQYKGKIEEGIDKRPLTPCILPDEDAMIEKYWINCFLTDPDGYGIEVVLDKNQDKLDRIRFFTTSTKNTQKFYSDILGMDLIKIQSHLSEISYPWNIFPGMSYYFCSNKKLDSSTCLQFAYAYDEDKLIMGNTFKKILLSFNDINKIEQNLIKNNIKITKNLNQILVKDYEGYEINIQKKGTKKKKKI